MLNTLSGTPYTLLQRSTSIWLSKGYLVLGKPINGSYIIYNNFTQSRQTIPIIPIAMHGAYVD